MSIDYNINGQVDLSSGPSGECLTSTSTINPPYNSASKLEADIRDFNTPSCDQDTLESYTRLELLMNKIL